MLTNGCQVFTVILFLDKFPSSKVRIHISNKWFSCFYLFFVIKGAQKLCESLSHSLQSNSVFIQYAMGGNGSFNGC